MQVLHGSFLESPVNDETIHLDAGLNTIETRSISRNHEHPQVFKILAALPVYFLRADTIDVVTAENWLENKYFIGRLPLMLVAVATVFLVYFFAMRLFGFWWGIFSLVLITFEPTMIAHARFITNDVMLSGASLLVLYLVWRYTARPSTKHSIMLGAALGTALLAKYSALILILYILILLMLYLVYRMHRSFYTSSATTPAIWPVTFLRSTFHLSIFILVPLVFIYSVYSLLTVNGAVPYPGLYVELLQGSRFFMPLLAYFYGALLVIEHSRVGHMYPQFFNGEFSHEGWLLYFPQLFALKTTLPFLFLSIAGILLLIFFLFKKGAFSPQQRIPLFILILFFVCFGFASVTSNLNIGIRHILPLFPIIILGLTAGFYALYNRLPIRIQPFLQLFLVLLAIVHAAFSLIHHPHQLSYSNVFAGGLHNAHEHYVDSNLDWGQDLYRLLDWHTLHAPDAPMAIEVFSSTEIRQKLVESNPLITIHYVSSPLPLNGLFAVSSHYMRMSEYWYKYENAGTQYHLLFDYEPLTIIGSSIYVFDMAEVELP
jgi:hypothetical protein